MSDALSESSRNERAFRQRKERREAYLAAMCGYLASPGDASRGRAQSAYAACVDLEYDELSEGVAIKFGMMLAGLRKGEEEAWAKFLSIHVGFDDASQLAAFKALSPFRHALIVEREDHEREDHPDGRVTLRGQAGEFLRALEVELIIRSVHYPISDMNKVKRSFVALILSDAARNRPRPEDYDH